MEYQKKKKQILSSVEYTNLLSFALVENKLQKNFKSIVEALLLSQTEGNQIKQDLLLFTKSTNKQFGLIHDKMSQLEKKLQLVKKKQQSKPSIHKDSDTEEINLHSENTSPIINVNLVQTPKNSQLEIPSKKSVNKEINQQNQYEQLKEKLNKLLSEQVDPYEIDKKLSTMKDSINILKAEVKALSDREAKQARRVSLESLQKIQKISGTQKSTQNIQALNAFNGIQAQLQKQINNLHIEVNTLKLCIQQIKQGANENRRKDSKTHIQLDDLIKNQKRLEQRVQNANDTFETQIKEIKIQLLNLQTKTLEQQNITKKSKKIIQTKQNASPNSNNQINDKISKLQAMIQGLVTQAQFKRFKSQIKDKITCLQNEDQNIRKQLKQQVQILTQILDSKQQQLSNIQKDIQEIQHRLNDMSQNCERRNNIAISRSDQLKKNLQNLRQDLEFYKSMNQTNGVQKEVNYQQENINTSGFNDSANKNNNQQVPNKSTQELKKYLNRKLHDQRTYLLGLIRDLEKKSSGGKTPLEQDLASIWDKLSQVNLFLNKKANQDDIKKSLGYFEKKLTNIYQRITSSDQNNEDARIGKTNWFCLSCDKNLHNYQGKVGQHVVWDSLPIKAGYTKYYNKQEKKSLPTLKR